MPISQRELMLLQISNIDLPGFELVPTAKRLINHLFERMKYGPVDPNKIERAIFEIQSSRVSVALAIPRLFGKFFVSRVEVGLFWGDLITCVRIVDATDVMRQDILDEVTKLPWSSFYEVCPHEKRWTYDEVLEMQIVQDRFDEVKKSEVEKLRNFMNIGL